MTCSRVRMGLDGRAGGWPLWMRGRGLLGQLRELFADEPYDVITAADARTALELASQSEPDLAILDVEMPDTDGFELCRALRETLSHGQLPILFLTARCTTPGDAVHGLDMGACDYVTKPFDAEELKARVRAALRAQAEHSADVAVAKAIGRRLADG